MWLLPGCASADTLSGPPTASLRRWGGKAWSPYLVIVPNNIISSS